MGFYKLRINPSARTDEGPAFDIAVNDIPAHHSVSRRQAYRILRSYAACGGIEELSIDESIRRCDKHNFRRYLKGDNS